MNTPGFGRRLAALTIDWAAAYGTAMLATQESYTNVVWWLPLALFAAETSIPTGLIGQSLGKWVTGLVVVGPDQRPIGIPRALARALLICLVVPPLVQNDDKRGVHDILVNSRVFTR